MLKRIYFKVRFFFIIRILITIFTCCYFFVSICILRISYGNKKKMIVTINNSILPFRLTMRNVQQMRIFQTVLDSNCKCKHQMRIFQTVLDPNCKLGREGGGIKWKKGGGIKWELFMLYILTASVSPIFITLFWFFFQSKLSKSDIEGMILCAVIIPFYFLFFLISNIYFLLIQ